MAAANDDKIVETLFSNRVTSGNKRIHTPPPPLHSKLGCLLSSIGSLNSEKNIAWRGWGRKSFISPFEVSKTSESPLRAKCLN